MSDDVEPDGWIHAPEPAPLHPGFIVEQEAPAPGWAPVAPPPAPARKKTRWPLWVGLGVVGVVLLFVVSALFAALLGGGGMDLADVDARIAAAAARIQASSEAFATEDYTLAAWHAHQAGEEIVAAQELVTAHGGSLASVDRYVLEDVLTVYMTMSRALEDMAHVTALATKVASLVAGVSDLDGLNQFLPQYELLATALENNAASWETVAHDLERLQKRPEASPYLGQADASMPATFQDLASTFRTEARTIRDQVATAKASSGYVPVDDRKLGGSTTHPSSPYFTAPVRTVFDTFDADGSGTIDLGEASSFYVWVEDHIKYRYDDEHYPKPIPGYPVGDGRPGKDYHQTPDETVTEGMGDCEDMAGLEVAFYNYWGITSFEAYVNAQSNTTSDHSIALVYVGATQADARDLVGRLDSVTFASENTWSVPAGVYMIVDNAYSNAFGYIDGQGITPGHFQVFEVIRLGQGFSRPVQ